MAIVYSQVSPQNTPQFQQLIQIEEKKTGDMFV
jgi:hypothetical protein